MIYYFAMKKGVAIIAVLFLVMFLSVGLVSANWFSDVFGKVTGKVIDIAAGDCSQVDGSSTWTASNNTVGLSINHDQRFFCLNSVYYACNWTAGPQSNQAFAVEAMDGQVVGNFKCNLNTQSWIAASNLPPVKAVDWTVLASNVTGNWTVRGVGDLNKDGIADVFFQTGSQIAYWIIGSSGVAVDWKGINKSAGNLQLKTVGDVDGDGTVDLLFQDSAGSSTIWYLNSNGTVRNNLSLGNQGAWQLKATGDLNKDGITDLFWQDSSGHVAVWYMNSNSSIKESVTLGSNLGTWQLKTVGDVDGDGTVDLIFQTSLSASVWLMNSTSGTVKGIVPLASIIPTSWKIIAAGDFNLDQTADILLQNSVNGATGYWTMASNSCLLTCKSHGTGVVAPGISTLAASCSYGGACGNVEIGTSVLNSHDFGYGLWWTYYYADGSKKDICACNGSTIVDSNNVYTGILSNKDYTFPLTVSDSSGKAIKEVELKVAEIRFGNISNWVTNNPARNISINYNCINECNTTGYKSKVDLSPDKYKVCSSGSDYCLHWSSPQNCAEIRGYIFNVTTQICDYVGNTCTLSCLQGNGEFCNNSASIHTFNTLNTTGNCCDGSTCLKCNPGFTFNPTTLSCINNSCSKTCGGLCSYANITNATTNNASCCDGSRCFICDPSFHLYNGNCVSNNCSGSLPGLLTVNNNSLIGNNSFLIGSSLVWNYTSSQTPGACQWTCNISKPSYVSATFDSCTEGVGPCSTNLCSNVSILNAQNISGTCTTGLCYACHVNYTYNGSACTRCVNGQIFQAQINQCVDASTANKCAYQFGSSLIYLEVKKRIEGNYCSSTLEMLPQKSENAACSNSYECVSNYCSSSLNKCVDLANQQTQQTGYLAQIVCYLKRFFGQTC